MSLAHEFSAQWHAFKNNPDRNTLKLPLPDAIFPLNVQVDARAHTVENIMSVGRGGVLADVANRVSWELQNEQGVTELILTASANLKAESENLLVVLNYAGTVRQ